MLRMQICERLGDYMKQKTSFLYTMVDNAADVRGLYVDMLHRGKSNEDAVREMLKAAKKDLQDAEFAGEFWIALADTMWNYGRLTEQVKTAALQFIHNQEDFVQRKVEAGEGTVESWTTTLTTIEEKLHRPQPKIKKVSPYRAFKNQWQVGDIYAYRLSGKESADAGWKGQNVFVHVVEKTQYWPGNEVPVVRVFRMMSPTIPDMQAFASAKYLPQFWGPATYDRRLDARLPYAVRLTDVLYNTLINATAEQEYQMFTYVGNREVLRLPLDRVGDRNESTCKLFELETVSSFRKWEGINVYDLLQAASK